MHKRGCFLLSVGLYRTLVRFNRKGIGTMPRPSKDKGSRAVVLSIESRDLRRLDELFNIDPSQGRYAVAEARRRRISMLLDNHERAVELEHIRETGRFAAPVAKVVFGLPVEDGDVDGVVAHLCDLPSDERAALLAKIRATFGLPEGRTYGDEN